MEWGVRHRGKGKISPRVTGKAKVERERSVISELWTFTWPPQPQVLVRVQVKRTKKEKFVTNTCAGETIAFITTPCDGEKPALNPRHPHAKGVLPFGSPLRGHPLKGVPSKRIPKREPPLTQGDPTFIGSPCLSHDPSFAYAVWLCGLNPHPAPFSFPSCSRKPKPFGPIMSRIAWGVSLYVHYIAFFLVPYKFKPSSCSLVLDSIAPFAFLPALTKSSLP